MKITDSPPPANDPNVKTEDADSSQNTKNEGASPFSQALAKKRGANQDSAQAKGGKRAENELDATAAGLIQTSTTLHQSIQPLQVGSKEAAALPAELQQVVREISVVVDAAGKQQVHIDLNSNVLKGLHIRIERQDGVMAILFQSTSDQVASLLSRHVDALSQGLAERGVTVADIRVAGPRESSRVQGYKSQSNLGGRSQSGRQGGRR
jgi:flagellar hook-length control protein FliK